MTTIITPMTCDGCGATMNAHAEKPVVPMGTAEALSANLALDGIIEEIHQCPRCGRVQSRRAAE